MLPMKIKDAPENPIRLMAVLHPILRVFEKIDETITALDEKP